MSKYYIVDKSELKEQMNALMKEAKAKIKEAKPLVNSLKKKNRETEQYKSDSTKSAELIKEALKLGDEYLALSKKLHKK